MLLRSSAVLVALLLQLSPPYVHHAHTQQEPTAFRVGVHAADGRRPLVGALVSARGVGLLGVTGPGGVVSFTGLPPGSHSVQARYLGYAPVTMHVRLVAGRQATMNFVLPVAPIVLPEVEVQARPSLLARNGFFERRGAGGTFVTRDEIERMRPRFLSDVLRRLGGISLMPSVGGTSRARMRGSGSSNRDCPIQYYVDGTMVAMFNIDDVSASDVEGLEIYRGAATVPPAFNKGSATCGVVVIWTRMR